MQTYHPLNLIGCIFGNLLKVLVCQTRRLFFLFSFLLNGTTISIVFTIFTICLIAAVYSQSIFFAFAVTNDSESGNNFVAPMGIAVAILAAGGGVGYFLRRSRYSRNGISSVDLIRKNKTHRRYVNVWVRGRLSDHALVLNELYKLYLNIGSERFDADLSVSAASEIETLSKRLGKIELTVCLASDDCNISPPEMTLTLPTSEDSNSIYFSIWPKRVGLKNEITILIYYKLNLIQVISVLFVVEEMAKHIKSSDQQDKLKLNTNVVLSARDGLDTVTKLAARK